MRNRHEEAQSVPGTAFVVIADRVRQSPLYVALRGALREKLIATYMTTSYEGFKRLGGATKMAEVALDELLAACPEADVDMGSALIPRTAGWQVKDDLWMVKNDALAEANRRRPPVTVIVGRAAVRAPAQELG